MRINDGETRLARDQLNEPWIVFGKHGSVWALGLGIKNIPVIHYVAAQTDEGQLTVQTDLSLPNAFRDLVLINEPSPQPIATPKTTTRNT